MLLSQIHLSSKPWTDIIIKLTSGFFPNSWKSANELLKPFHCLEYLPKYIVVSVFCVQQHVWSSWTKMAPQNKDPLEPVMEPFDEASERSIAAGKVLANPEPGEEIMVTGNQ